MKKNELKSTLQQSIATIVFTKLDGNERIMKCTLKSNMLPIKEIVEFKESEVKKVRVESDEIIPVFDLENNGWRTIRIESIKSITIEG